MRVLALLPALAFPGLMALSFACSTPPEGEADAQASPAKQVQTSGNDCAVIAAVANEKYHFGADHPAPPLKLADGWSPGCAWSDIGLGVAWKDDPQNASGSDPRERLKWVEFKKPVYDSQGATIETSQMAGPLAGTGYSCRLRSGIAGWTVTECKTIWVS